MEVVIDLMSGAGRRVFGSVQRAARGKANQAPYFTH
jgi:hypothetical protein